MRRFITVAFILCGQLLSTFAAPPSEFVPGQILVKPKASVSDDEFSTIIHGHGANQKAHLKEINVHVLSLPENAVNHVLDALAHNPKIEFAERDYIAHTAYVPNDTYVQSGDEWHLTKIQAQQAWDLARGKSSVIIAILDTGVMLNHPDLAANLLPGYNYVANNSNVADDNGHGTAVAGAAAAIGDNGVGVAGVAYGCKILPVKVADAGNYASYSAIASGINYAVNQGARVINISIAGSSASSTLQNAVNNAWAHNAIVVAAAGNNGNSTPMYPAACANVMAVSATEPNDTLSTFSCYGSHIAVSAPGNIVWTTQNDTTYPYGGWWGTSLASPVAAGVAALVASANTSLSNTQIVALIKNNADDLGATGFDTSFGWGRVNARRAVAAAMGGTDSVAPTTTIASPGSGNTLSGMVSVQVNSTDNVAVVRVECYANNIPLGTNTSASTSFPWSTFSNTNGSYTLTARAYDAAGNGSTASIVNVIVSNTPPAVTSQPTNQTVWTGGSATFVVTCSGTAPLRYQWKFNSAAIAGATNSIYTKTNLQTADAGNYSVTITNALGSVTSQNAALTVNVPPAPQVQPLTRSGNTFTIFWSSITGRTYRVQYAASTTPTGWNTLTPDVVATSSLSSKTDQPSNAPVRFYRVLLLP